MTQSVLSRRRLLRMAVVAAIALARPYRKAVAQALMESESALVQALRQIISDRHAAHVVGAAYLRVRPNETDSGVLEQLITGRRACASRPGEEVDAVRLVIRNLIAEDFAIGDTVMVDGWLLSVTECRACALLAVS